ncbi:MAG: hypothetical protein JKY65_04205 [Planctomycetes bacterium]|nr:hypothetical protein [Planctomycetota bacterium]
MRAQLLVVSLLLLTQTASAQSRERVEPQLRRTPPAAPRTTTGRWTSVTVEGTRGRFMTRARGGPSQDRVDIAFVAEGYTRSEQADFVSHCERVMRLFESRPPYSTYSKLFNIHYVFFPSTESGIGRTKAKNTVFGAHFNKNWSFSTGITGDRAKIQRFVTAALPGDCEADRIAVVCNDWRSGGTSWGKISFSTRKGFWANIPYVSPEWPLEDTVAHELGHSVGGLSDEYTSGGRDYDHAKVLNYIKTWPSPNVTSFNPLPTSAVPWQSFAKKNEVPWAHWIEPASRVPSKGPAVGLYLGALYSSDWAYRPSKKCAMKSSGSAPFCAPCQEGLILRFHAFSKPTRFESTFEGDELVLRIHSVLPQWTRRHRARSRFPDALWERIQWTWTKKNGVYTGAEARIPLSLIPERALVLEVDVVSNDPAVRKRESTLQGADFVLRRPPSRANATGRDDGITGALRRQ